MLVAFGKVEDEGGGGVHGEENGDSATCFIKHYTTMHAGVGTESIVLKNLSFRF